MRRTWLPVLAAGVLALSACGSVPGSGVNRSASAAPRGLAHGRHGYLYFLNYSVDHGAVMRVAVPGGRPRRVVRIGDSEVSGIAVAAGRLYWLAGVSSGQIVYVQLRGAPRIRVLVRHLGTSDALTAAGGWLYWVDDGRFVGRVRLDGSHLTRRFLDLRAFNPLNVAADRHYLYLSDCRNTIGRVDLVGRHFDPSFITLGQDACPWGLTVGGQYLYWAEGGPPSYVGRAALSGARPDDQWLNLHSLVAGFYVAADSHDVFFDWQWTTGSSPGEDLKIGRAQTDGSYLRRYVWLGQGPFTLTSPGAG